MRKYYESSMATYSGRSCSLVAKIAAETTASDLVLEETAPGVSKRYFQAWVAMQCITEKITKPHRIPKGAVTV